MVSMASACGLLQNRGVPALFQPNADVVFAWKKTLSGPPGSFANLTQCYMTPESWYFTK